MMNYQTIKKKPLSIEIHKIVIMQNLLLFLQKLELYKIHYTIEHNRDDYIMVLVTIPGERWEVEFDAEGNVEIEVFKNSTGVDTDECLLDRLFESDVS